MLPLISAFRALANNREIFWFVQQGVIAISKMADGERKRKIAHDFMVAAQVKAELLGFEEAMAELDKKK